MMDYFRSPFRYPKSWTFLLVLSAVLAFFTHEYFGLVAAWASVVAAYAFLNMDRQTSRLQSLGIISKALIILLGLGMIAWGVTGLLGMHVSVEQLLGSAHPKSINMDLAFLYRA